MSLTSHLKNSNSPVRQFLREQFPNRRAVQKGCREKIAKATTLRPSVSVRYCTIGNALNYRLWYYFAVTPVEGLVAFHGASMAHYGNPLGMGLWEGHRQQMGTLPPDSPFRRRALSIEEEERRRKGEIEPGIEFFVSLTRVLEQIQPVGRRLDREQEALLARYCFVLALYEELFRAGMFINSPLFQTGRMALEETLAIASDAEVDDLCALSWAFYDEFSHLLTHPVILNPTFDGSGHVGGADADFIVDSCLVELKTTVDPCVEMQYLHQLLGYVLLDYSDQYAIREVGILFARQRVMIQWSLDELIRTMRDGDLPSLSELRSRFQEVLRDMVAERRLAREAELEARRLARTKSVYKNQQVLKSVG